MRSRLFATLFAVATAASADTTASERPPDPMLAEIGAPYFQSYCASCHGMDARGSGPAATSLRTPPADLTRIAARRGGKFPEGEIAQFIDGRFSLEAHGTREMPVWGEVFTRSIPDADSAESISRGKVLVLLEYLRSIQVDSPAPALPSYELTRARMREIFAAMRTLLPLSLDADAFEDPEQRQNIGAALALLDQSAAGLARHGRSQEVPFAHLSRTLANDAHDIHTRFEQGHVREARYLVQTLAETCVACHSRLPAASDAPTSRDFMADAAVKKLPLPQRAKLAYATRQFDDALALYEKLMQERSVPANEIDLDGHLDDYLELVLRVRGEPARAQRALTRFAQRDDLSPALRGEVASWQTSLARLTNRGPVASPVEEARREIARAEAGLPERDERDALVDYLDASALLHRHVADASVPRSEQADAYYLLGLIETRTGRSFWLSQAEAYLETAIRLAPGEPVARDAFALLDEFLVSGYSGSSGTHVPPDVREKLDTLRRISE
jgi:tetratricopeptide (TPR) repeat protein